MKATINNTLLAKLKSQGKYYDVWDSKLGGFHLRVNPTGNVTYRCAYARNKIATIGKASLLTPTQARDRAKQILGDAAVGIYPHISNNASKLTLHDYLDGDYSRWRLIHRKNAVEDLTRMRVNFFADFGNLLLSEITPLLVEKWRLKKLSRDIKAATVNRDIAFLKAALAKAVEWGFIENNPIAKVKPIKTDKSAKVRYLDKEEATRLRNALDQREAILIEERKSANQWRRERGYSELPTDSLDYMKSLILLSINTGLRRGEILNLMWENIILDKAVLTVTGDTAKSGKTRHIPLNKEALCILRQWRERTISQELVFSGKNGEKLKSVKKAWARILKLADIKNFRWHDLRHHFASKLAMKGVDLNTIRELLGHSDIQMTLRYAHLAPEHKAKAVEQLLVD
ncbi:MAG: site specific recombinase [Gammaproteobacteria bacterium]|nr:site specific recombinase [Gammaproteobacteria bacterium]